MKEKLVFLETLSSLHDSLKIRNFWKHWEIQKFKLFFSKYCKSGITPLYLEDIRISTTVLLPELLLYWSISKVFLGQPQQAIIIYWQCILYLTCHSHWHLILSKGPCFLHLDTLSVRLQSPSQLNASIVFTESVKICRTAKVTQNFLWFVSAYQ